MNSRSTAINATTPALRSKELADQFGEQVADARELDLEQFAAVLRSNAVCAWNECYAKRK